MEPTEPTALTPGWRAWGRMLAAGTAVTFAAGTLLSALDALNVTTPEPEFAKGADLPSRILATLENQSERFAWVLAATLLAAASFALLAALGPVLRRAFRGSEPQRSLITGTLLMGGIIGVIAELGFIGGQAVASDATYCECAFKDAQLIARSGLLDLISSVQSWLTYGAVVIFAIGFLAIASAARQTEGVPRAWGALSVLLGVLLLAVAVINAGLPPLANSAGWQIDTNLVAGVPSLLVLLVLIPWWALWLRSWLREEPAST